MYIFGHLSSTDGGIRCINPSLSVFIAFIISNTLAPNPLVNKQEAQLMLTTGSTRLAVSRGQQTWYHSTCNI